MSYADDITSQADGDVVELYEFVGSATTWRLTSAAADYVFDGDTYTAQAGLTRGDISSVTTASFRPLSVQMPTAATVVQHYALGTPPRGLYLTLTSVQRNSGEGEVIWQGEVSAITPMGQKAELGCQSLLGSRLSTKMPGLTIRDHCQHALYDDHCRVARGDFDHATTVASVSATDGRLVTVAGVGAFADQWFRGGEIVRDSDGERRGIVSQIGAVLKLVSPFRTLANPDAVTMYAGCDHTAATCDDKFSNLLNFSGFPSMPKRNPWRLGSSLRTGDDS